MSASLRRDLPELDLHGLYSSDALHRLELWLFELSQSPEKEARVIFGGGTGKLGEIVKKTLTEHPLIEQIVDEGASCLVLL